MFKTMIAGALLTYGAGVAIAQTEAPAADANAGATVTTDVQATAKEDPAPAANADNDASAKADVQATAKEAPAPAADATANTNADAKADDADDRKAKKARAKAECLKINVGKPHDC